MITLIVMWTHTHALIALAVIWMSSTMFSIIKIRRIERDIPKGKRNKQKQTNVSFANIYKSN